MSLLLTQILTSTKVLCIPTFWKMIATQQVHGDPDSTTPPQGGDLI